MLLISHTEKPGQGAHLGNLACPYREVADWPVPLRVMSRGFAGLARLFQRKA